jgi:hypothetical protein
VISLGYYKLLFGSQLTKEHCRVVGRKQHDKRDNNILTWIWLIGWHSVKRMRNSCRTIIVANSGDGSDVNDIRFQYMQERHDTQHTWHEVRLKHTHALWDFTTR